MLKQSLLYLILSVLIIFFAPAVRFIIAQIHVFYAWFNFILMPIFSQSDLGVMTRKVIVLVSLPMILAGIPTLIYRLIKGKFPPFFFEITWLSWLVVALSIVMS